jgi:hypothetical protein
MVTFDNVPPVWTQAKFNAFLDAVESWINGFTPSGTFTSPYTYLLNKTVVDGTSYYSANNAFQTVYGGSSSSDHHNGSVDGTDFAAVFNAAAASGGVIEFEPNQTFSTDTLLLINDNTIIHGNGATIQQTGEISVGSVLSTSTYTSNISELATYPITNNVVITDLKFTTAGGFTAGNAVSLACSDNVYVARIHATSMNKCVETHGRTSNVTIEDCTDITCAGATDAPFYSYPTFGSMSDLYNIKLIRPVVVSPTGDGIMIQATQALIDGAYVYNAGSEGIKLRGTGVTARNCHVYTSASYNFMIFNVGGTGADGEDINLTDCYGENAGASGVFAQYVNHFALNNVKIKNAASGAYSFYLHTCEHVEMGHCHSIDSNSPQVITQDILTTSVDSLIVHDCDFTEGKQSCSFSGTNIKHHHNYGYVSENSGYSIGTGSEQTIAHGCSFTPTATQVYLTERRIGGALAYQSSAPDATNIYITATNSKDYNWRVAQW